MSLSLLNILSQEIVDQILNEGMQLLMNPGVRVKNMEALDLLAAGGANVNKETQVAQIPEKVIRKALETAPGSFYLYNLDGQQSIHYGGDDVHFDPGSAAVTVLASEEGEQRPPNTLDFVNFVKLVEALPQLDAQSTAFVCRDVPEGIGDMYRLYLALSYMNKPIITGAFGKDTWWTMWEMLTLVSGGEKELAEKPIAVFDVCPTPPLLWSDLTCQNLIDCARKGVPAELISMPLAGATAPVTLAGSVVQHTAESLSGIVIHQLAKPGSPIVWGGAPATFDMREGTTPMGDVGTWMIDLAYIQIGKELGLPTHTYMGSTDSKTLDMQSGLESAGGTILAALSGINMVSGAGMIDFLRCQSFEKLVIDAEAIGMAKRLVRGIDARQPTIALDLIQQSGHHADFLKRPETRKWFPKEFYLPSNVIDRGSLDAWVRNGKKSMFHRAQERVNSLLSGYSHSPLDDEKLAGLRKIAEKAAKKVGMDKLPLLPKN